MNKNFNVNFILFYLSKLEFRKKIRLKYEQKKLEIKITRYDIFYTKIKKKRQDFVVRNRKKKKKECLLSSSSHRTPKEKINRRCVCQKNVECVVRASIFALYAGIIYHFSRFKPR